MAEQKRKLKGIADLYSIDDARKTSNVNPPTVPEPTIPIETIPKPTIPEETTLNTSINHREASFRGENRHSSVRSSVAKETIPEQTIVRQAILKNNIVDVNHGYYPIYNDISDRLIPELKLKPHEQAILQRLYRLSRGWKSKECVVGLGALSKFCVMSRSQVQRSLAILIEKRLIEDLGEEKRGGREGKRYRVLSELPSIPGQTIPKETIVCEKTSIVTENTVVSQTIPTQTTNKYSNKDLINTHQKPEGVGSKFSLEECRKYADHLCTSGKGIKNPGGFAMSIYRSGAADAFIENFINPVADINTVDTSACPDCKGTGFFYPQGVEHGVARCKHEHLVTPPSPKPRLTENEITEHSNLISELFSSGYTLEQAKEQFGEVLHPEDWQLIMSRVEQKGA